MQENQHVYFTICMVSQETCKVSEMSGWMQYWMVLGESLVEHEISLIGSLQFTYDGHIAYRVYTHADEFGQVALPEKIVIID